MSNLMPFVVIGVTTGAVYALAAMGLVLTYKTSGVFNFAHGAVGMFATFLFHSMRESGVPTALAVAIAVLLIAPAMGLVIDRVLLRQLSDAPTATSVVVTLGLVVGLQGLAVAIYGGATRRVEPLFPTSTFRFQGVNVGIDQTIVVGVALAAGLLLAVFFSRSQLGLSTRAVVGDRELTELVGVNTSRITSFSWMLGAAFAALSGILFVPAIGLDSLLLTLLVVQAFGAAIVGRLRSLTLTNVGAYAIAIVGAISTKYIANHRALAGLPTSLPFIVLFVVLVASPRGTFAEARNPSAYSLHFTKKYTNRFPTRTVVSGVAVALVLPVVLSSVRLVTATTAIIFVLIFASLSLLVGLSRQVSLCHAVFVVFGATTLSHLTDAGIPYFAALALSGLIIVPVGAVVAVPAIRLSGVFLALATFGFGALAQYLLFGTFLAFGSAAQVAIPRPAAFEGDAAFYYLALAVVVGGVIAIELVRVTRLGRVLRALSDSPTALESVGINPTASQVLVFCITAFFAAVAGGLLGSLIGILNTTSLDFFQSLVWLTVLVAAGAASLGGALLAAVLLVVTPALLDSVLITEWQPVAFGAMAIAFAQSPNGIVGSLRMPDLAKLAARSRWRMDGRRRHQDRLALVVRQRTAS